MAYIVECRYNDVVDKAGIGGKKMNKSEMT